MPHASWKAALRLSLVSVPVQAFNAENSAKSDISFNQLHDKCKSRIEYQKVCPVHGEVTNSEIVKGYEHAKNEYVIVDPEEIDAIRGKADQAVEIDAFVQAGSIDPKYFDGRMYYLMPDGEAAKKRYAVLLEALKANQLWGVAIAHFSNRDHLVVLREVDGVLSAAPLHYTSELRSPTEISGKLELPPVTREEARLAATLIKASTKKQVNLEQYHDHYNDELRELIEAKVEGRKIVAPAPAKTTAVINLMDALKKSIATKSKAAEGAEGRSRIPSARKATSSRETQIGRLMRCRRGSSICRCDSPL